MSQIGSSSGVRVAAQPLSNVYTVLLLLGAVALVATAVMLGVTMNDRYGCILGVTDEGKRAKEAPEAAKRRQDSVRAELEQTDKAIKEFPEGVTVPAVGGDVTPPAPAVPTPPAPAAPTPPAPAAPTPPAGDATPPAPEGGATPPAPAPAGAPAAN